MKTTSEKEKKLDEALNKLINLNLNQNFKENFLIRKNLMSVFFKILRTDIPYVQ